ncbi:hypothetical protein LJR034_008824 [Caballeronia sp. LjRoot34]|uniref:hypothetical protein n=1 Tax=Caballeronia sp. LjRoot34 TaxID=3342325 RepID=UPI003ED154D4
MKAIICRQTKLPEGHEEVHRFTFELHDGSSMLPVRESISLRTARVVVAHLADGNALIQMFRAIVSADPANYQSLVGQVFQDSYIENGPSDKVDDAGAGWQQAQQT